MKKGDLVTFVYHLDFLRVTVITEESVIGPTSSTNSPFVIYSRYKYWWLPLRKPYRNTFKLRYHIVDIGYFSRFWTLFFKYTLYQFNRCKFSV